MAEKCLLFVQKFLLPLCSEIAPMGTILSKTSREHTLIQDAPVHQGCILNLEMERQNGLQYFCIKGNYHLVH